MAALGAVALLAGCGSSSESTPLTQSSVNAVVVGHETPPKLGAFFAHPVATPSDCPSGDNGTTTGLRSPWVGHVDVSVFLAASITPAERTTLHRALTSAATVGMVYEESSAEAYKEFQRLYTCSSQLSAAAIPSSYRVVLTEAASIATRDDLVTRLVHTAGVASVSCDPSLPCVSTVRAAEATPGPALSASPIATARATGSASPDR